MEIQRELLCPESLATARYMDLDCTTKPVDKRQEDKYQRN